MRRHRKGCAWFRRSTRRIRPGRALALLAVLALAAGSCTDRARAPVPETATATDTAVTAAAAEPRDSPTPDDERRPTTPAADAPAHSSRAPLAVILVTEGDVLNVRSAAGVDHPIVGELPPHTTALMPTGNTADAGGERWLEVRLPAGDSGWVNARFTTQHVDTAEFCGDRRVDALLTELGAALQYRDGRALAALVNPQRGLTVRRHWWNPEVRYTGPDVASIFTADARRDWGVADGTGFPITAAFDEVAVPLFDRLYAGTVTRHCNDIEHGSGSSAGYRLWPFEYANINYYALYRAASPALELDWNTWAAGIEYVDGKPYVAFLVHYQWEI